MKSLTSTFENKEPLSRRLLHKELFLKRESFTGEQADKWPRSKSKIYDNKAHSFTFGCNF